MSHGRVVFAVGAVLYVAALVLPAVGPLDPRFSDATYCGADAFRVGWRALLLWEPAELDWWVLSAAWLANPAVWVALVAAGCGCRRTAIVAAGAALILGLAVLP